MERKYENEVDQICQELDLLKKAVLDKGLPYKKAFDKLSTKSLLLAIASYFEYAIMELIKDFAKNSSNNNFLSEFIQNQTQRKYYTLFDWNVKNVNKFYKSFGPDFKKMMQQRQKRDKMDKKIVAFIDLNIKRNELVHQNYATYELTYTIGELQNKFEEANKFVLWMIKEFQSIYRNPLSKS